MANSNKISARLDVVEGRAGSYVRVTNSVPRFPTAAAGEWCGRSWGEARTEGIAPFGGSGPGPAISDMMGQPMLLNTALLIVAIVLLVLAIWGWDRATNRPRKRERDIPWC